MFLFPHSPHPIPFFYSFLPLLFLHAFSLLSLIFFFAVPPRSIPTFFLPYFPYFQYSSLSLFFFPLFLPICCPFFLPPSLLPIPPAFLTFLLCFTLSTSLNPPLSLPSWPAASLHSVPYSPSLPDHTTLLLCPHPSPSYLNLTSLPLCTQPSIPVTQSPWKVFKLTLQHRQTDTRSGAQHSPVFPGCCVRKVNTSVEANQQVHLMMYHVCN